MLTLEARWDNTQLIQVDLKYTTLGLQVLDPHIGMDLCLVNVYINQFYSRTTSSHPTRGLDYTDHKNIFPLYKPVSFLRCTCTSTGRCWVLSPDFVRKECQ